jgi:DNA-binding YbaB/EbfC family protein
MFDKLKDLNNLRAQANNIQKSLAAETISGEAVKGLVKITMNGNQEIQDVFIDSSLLTPENQHQLQNAVQEAFEQCSKELKSLMIRKMQSGEIQM